MNAIWRVSDSSTPTRLIPPPAHFWLTGTWASLPTTWKSFLTFPRSLVLLPRSTFLVTCTLPSYHHLSTFGGPALALQLNASLKHSLFGRPKPASEPISFRPWASQLFLSTHPVVVAVLTGFFLPQAAHFFEPAPSAAQLCTRSASADVSAFSLSDQPFPTYQVSALPSQVPPGLSHASFYPAALCSSSRASQSSQLGLTTRYRPVSSHQSLFVFRPIWIHTLHKVHRFSQSI